jgi:hypothetical protein
MGNQIVVLEARSPVHLAGFRCSRDVAYALDQ